MATAGMAISGRLLALGRSFRWKTVSQPPQSRLWWRISLRRHLHYHRCWLRRHLHCPPQRACSAVLGCGRACGRPRKRHCERSLPLNFFTHNTISLPRGYGTRTHTHTQNRTRKKFITMSPCETPYGCAEVTAILGDYSDRSRVFGKR